MSVLNLSEDLVECPLCMEPLEMDDLNFYPCTCGYQICRFCWHRIRTDENGLCPACRKAYPENPADFKPLSHEELQRIKQEKRQKDAQRKQKVTENRKHLANVRVVQKNLVFGPSASAYVTYQRAEDALRAIQAVNNIHVDGRTLKASLGTTKYCSHFMKNQQCPKPDCIVTPPQATSSGNSTSKKRTPSGGSGGDGKENTSPKGQPDTMATNPSAPGADTWPTLTAVGPKESKKSKSSKSDRTSNGTSRHTPTDEHNNNNNSSNNNNINKSGVGSKERDRSCNTGSSSSSTSSTSSNGLGVDLLNHSISPVATSSPSSSHESCTSSASTTPPPSFIPPSPPSSSPVPVSCGVQDLCQEELSPLPTPPSSLSSSSERSSCLQLPQQFSSRQSAAAASSLFSDNSNSFFSSGPSLPLQRTSPPLPPPAASSPPQHNHQLHHHHHHHHHTQHDTTPAS
ncbi:CCR4-NOT transcription complex subunit 4-like [Homarus americanus]|uniref:CCR4-NOT transcription complex subunit 4-like n=1 Tax=Homarus americanus TaxID=6706 RepID=A0A8J5TN40_HOMAM|nr:CCR4-NOT transcription complex subunit 4-like [Homarus americanus]